VGVVFYGVAALLLRPVEEPDHLPEAQAAAA
jgi:hypothetical protein